MTCFVLPDSCLSWKEQTAVDALVGALLLLHRPGTDEAERPPLELVRVLCRELAGALYVGRLADHAVSSSITPSPKVFRRRYFMRFTARWVMSIPTQRRLRLLGDGNRRAAAAEGVEHHVALVAAG